MDENTGSGRENAHKYKNKFMGKLFKEKKPANDADVEVHAFLHGSSDKLHMMQVEDPPNPPSLSRIDTNSARRWPTAAEVQSVGRAMKGRPASPPKPSRKGLSVRFTKEHPEIIGHGGDEATSPVSEIGARRSQSQPPRHQPPPDQARPPGFMPNATGAPGNTQDFRPGPMRRTQTGFESIPEQRSFAESSARTPRINTEDDYSNNDSIQTDPYDPTSFAARVKAEMQAAEGRALHAARSPDVDHLQPGPSQGLDPELTPQLRELHMNTMRNSMISASPGLPGQLVPGRPQTPTDSQKSASISGSPILLSRTSTGQASHRSPANSITESLVPLSRTSTLQTTPNPTPLMEYPLTLSRTPTIGLSKSSSSTDNPFTLSRTPTMQSAVLAVGDEALQDFSRRVAHLYTLFRLAADSVKPISTCSLEESVRAALWWFLRGRMNLEATARERPKSPQAQQANAFVRQQSYSDLGKALWIIESVGDQVSDLKSRTGGSDIYAVAILESHQNVLSGLRKLTMSMKRNDLLPREDVVLPQGLDNTIWVHDEGNRSLVASQRHTLAIGISDALPLGDSSWTFCYGRMFVQGILEEEAASQYYRAPLLVSLMRGVKEKELKAMITSQDGSLQLCIQEDGNLGPTWDDVSWQSKSNSLKVELPRGFVLRLHCSEQDYRFIWGSYDYQTKIHASLIQRRGEDLIFEAVLKNFKYIDQNPESRFPKDILPNCQLRVFEKMFVDKAATGVRTMHRGFRIALNTSPQTKTLRGIDQDLPPKLPIQFNFLRGEDGQPALDLKIHNPKSNYKVVFGFNDASERAHLHTLLTGTALRDGEDVVAEGAMKAFSIAGHSFGATHATCLKILDWQNFRIFNEYDGDLEGTNAVLSDHLRVVLDFKTGSLTDRINVAPGELQLRLDVKVSKELKLLRQPQEDMTISVTESQVSRELPHELAELLGMVEKSQSTRTYLFPGLQELHLFQAAVTGFVVLYDGMATSFNISRRRMVVPIYKKWDAASTRLQVVRREKVVQLVAFFENFNHGDCMNFTLKSTDVFETSSRSGKHSLKIVDAKFAMPKARGEEEDSVGHQFVCLDMPEYPGEHDDITILFDTDSERDRFAEALPAPSKMASRMASVRR
ncbi:hypothetical protein LARI1_G008412 [Lachnellula arida]|uniref:Uncharacterized protein n=1 Tax=Lachnellula arida TaxID=1316785 RepID=A0A8T9B593_9HELO|nr:hypothetical protein LARI1_G008412 [Lachnellula arida]